ncbi:MAG: hypothetical protein K940chlam7_00560 [Chlamydiae bacterium]|nr:hypothetical protein [Chlamydiota bacterium]
MALSAGLELALAILGPEKSNRLFPSLTRKSQILDKTVSSKALDKKGSPSRLVQKAARSGSPLKPKKRKVSRTTPRSAALLLGIPGDGKLG